MTEMTPEEWNALSPEEQDAIIEAEIEAAVYEYIN